MGLTPSLPCVLPLIIMRCPRQPGLRGLVLLFLSSFWHSCINMVGFLYQEAHERFFFFFQFSEAQRSCFFSSHCVILLLLAASEFVYTSFLVCKMASVVLALLFASLWR